MSTLEDDLRTAAKNGFMFCSIHRHSKTDNWVVDYRVVTSTEYQKSEDPDIVVAFQKALRAGTRADKEGMKAIAAKAAKPRRNIEDLA